MKTFGLALGGGGARGIAHIPVLEAIDDLNLRPAAIAGTSIGSLIGAAYAAGMSGKAIRRHVIALAHDRTDVFRRLIAARAGTFANLFAVGFGSATLIDAEKFCAQFMPETLPEDFESLQIPLTVMASDLYRRRQVPFSSGALRPALAASIALPSLMRPVVIDDKVLVDGGATNPLPFDQLRGHADIVVAVDISGEPNEERRDLPSPWECLVVHRAGHGQCDHHREAEARRARPHGAAQCRAVPHARLLPGERHPARRGARQGRDPQRSKRCSGDRRGSDRTRPGQEQAEDQGRISHRTSQRRASSSVALLRLIQFAAAKMQTATDLSFCSVTRNESPIVGALAAREGDALDLEAFADQRLERLLLLRAAIGRLQQAHQPESRTRMTCS